MCRCEDPPAASSASSAPTSSSSNKCRRCLKLNKDCTFVLSVVETRGRSSYLRDDAEDTPRPREDYVQIFESVILPCCPIVSPLELSSPTHSSAVFLTCIMRLFGALLVGAEESELENVQQSINSYIATKSPMTIPAPQNVQALALLALRVEERAAGVRFATAVRMATALGWNRVVNGREEDEFGPLAMTDQLWWTLVCEDIWLHVFTGSPTLISAGDYTIPRPDSPEFMCDVIALSEVARLILRPRSMSVPAEFSAVDVLSAWEIEHPDIVSSEVSEYPQFDFMSAEEGLQNNTASPSFSGFVTSASHTPASPTAGSTHDEQSQQQQQQQQQSRLNTTLSPKSIIQLLYAAVVGLFVLDKAIKGSFDRRFVTEHPLRRPILYKACFLEMTFKTTAFARWRCLLKLTDIVGAALYAIGDDYGRYWASDRGFEAENVQSLDDLWEWWAVVDRARG